MSRFTAPLVVTPLNDGRTWEILHSTEDDEHFAYEIGEEDSGVVIRPPARFQTDFASVPRFLWWLFPRWGRYGNAAVIHDYLYQHGYFSLIDNETPETNHPDRKQADEIFLEAMGVLDTKKWQKYLIYWGVRVGGWYVWRKARAT